MVEGEKGGVCLRKSIIGVGLRSSLDFVLFWSLSDWYWVEFNFKLGVRSTPCFYMYK